MWGDGKIVRDYLYISDLVDLIVRCWDGGVPGRVPYSQRWLRQGPLP